jgi:hypothetical protein
MYFQKDFSKPQPKKEVCSIVLSCIVLYCIVLYCMVLCCVVLYCIVLCCVALCCVVLYCLVLCCIILCCSPASLSFRRWSRSAPCTRTTSPPHSTRTTNSQ